MITDEELDRLRSLGTAGDRCWAFNALPQVKQEKWRIYRRIKFLSDHLEINPENAKIETYGYFYNRGDRDAAKLNWHPKEGKGDIYARPDKSMKLVDDKTVIDF
ncbi:hypothetical protein [Mesorhizobium sp. B4-1-1]|uniref:hypothetical protein n=1 Tax=Mesorhizobium sp. B4-1-1 TaxID=2589890 RepID=UPI0011262EBB|nr:hypothetical protein [Mesorhizobium sp. B4-1-1]TPI21943.1 hypothetical protein FJW10_05380 [Mesorhizobium sp. B4-1-1]